MEILIENQQTLQTIPQERLTKKAAAILNALDCPEGELSLLIVDDAQIASLNQQYRGRTGPTNVLAFAMNEGAFAEVAPHLLGDVVISMETCVREAEEAGLDFRDHFDALLVHGILHLFGYDHETSPEEAARMGAMSMKLLRALQGNR